MQSVSISYNKRENDIETNSMKTIFEQIPSLIAYKIQKI